MNKKVKFGKYKGLTYNQIVKIDKDYIIWLMNNTKDSGLYIKLNQLLK